MHSADRKEHCIHIKVILAPRIKGRTQLGRPLLSHAVDLIVPSASGLVEGPAVLLQWRGFVLYADEIWDGDGYGYQVPVSRSEQAATAMMNLLLQNYVMDS